MKDGMSMIDRDYKKPVAGFLMTLKELVILLLIVFLIRTFGFGLYQVPSGSMETTMLVGERFFADKFTILFSKPKNGDIISFNDPRFPYSSNSLVRLFQEYVGTFSGPINWTKRVIGIPGDRVQGIIEDGVPVVYLNDKKLDEPYVNKYPLLARWPEDPAVLKEQMIQEGLAYIRRTGVHVVIDELVTERMLYMREWRSYDPQAAYDKQPFYRFVPDRVIHVPPTWSEKGVFVDTDGRLLMLPHAPNQLGDPEKMSRQGNSYWNGSDEFYVELGPNQYWLMGDNRRGSHDCRAFGPVNGGLIHGKIVFRIWSLDSTSSSWLDSWWIIDLIKHPIDFWSRLRWNRFFQVVR